MKKVLLFIFPAIVFLATLSWKPADYDTISTGSQPQISVDNKGVILVVYGNKDSIFCATSVNQGLSFGKPVLVGHIADMHLGMSRGPQLASSANYSVITAMDKTGNIHWFRLNNALSKWKSMGVINDIDRSAPEGLMGIAADKKDGFYTVWLDTRTGGNNQVYFSSLKAKTNAWSKNTLAYGSPDGHVCECCKPNIAVNGAEVAIIFRNWLNGSRDLYVTKSANGGKEFQPAQKMGTDTWKLNGCPMDGGGIVIDALNRVNTTWQRKGNIYYAQPGEPETYIGKGRTTAIASSGTSTVITFQTSDTLKLMALKNKDQIMVGKGGFLKSIVLPDNKVLCVWEQGNKVKFKKI